MNVGLQKGLAAMAVRIPRCSVSRPRPAPRRPTCRVTPSNSPSSRALSRSTPRTPGLVRRRRLWRHFQGAASLCLHARIFWRGSAVTRTPSWPRGPYVHRCAPQLRNAPRRLGCWRCEVVGRDLDRFTGGRLPVLVMDGAPSPSARTAWPRDRGGKGAMSRPS